MCVMKQKLIVLYIAQSIFLFFFAATLKLLMTYCMSYTVSMLLAALDMVVNSLFIRILNIY